jgi:hypothetical protein
MKLRMLPIETDTKIDQFMNGVIESQVVFGIERSFGIGHLACIHCSKRACEGFLVGEELVERSWRDVCFQGNRVCGGFVIPQASEERGRRPKQILQALLSPGVPFPFWIENRHRPILAEKKPSKNLHPTG